VNQDNLGGFGSTTNTNLQTISVTNTTGSIPRPAYFNGTVYIQPSNEGIESFPLSNGQLTGPSATGTTPTRSRAPRSASPPTAIPMALPGTSSMGRTPLLRAYDASNVSDELYDSNQAGSRDELGAGVKFAVPTVADGHVFVGTSSSLAVFGLLSEGQTTTPSTPTGLVATPETGTDVHLNWNANSTNAASFLIERSTSGGPFVQVGSVGAPFPILMTSPPWSARGYTYEVEATNSAGTSGASNAANVFTPAIAGLVGYWQFNEGDGVTTADASGNNDTGTLTGETTWIAGRIGPPPSISRRRRAERACGHSQ